MAAPIILSELLILIFSDALLYHDQWLAAFTVLALYVATLWMFYMRPS